MNLYFNPWVTIISESLIIQITEWLFNSIELHSRLTAVHLVWFAFRFDNFFLFKKVICLLLCIYVHINCGDQIDIISDPTFPSIAREVY